MTSVFNRIFIMVALSLGTSKTGFAQQPPSRDELQRFVSAYRVDDAVALIAKDSIYEASQQAGPNRLYFACVNRELTPELFKAVAVDVIGEQVSDAGVINQLSEFFESGTGKTMRDHILSNLAKRAARRASGQATFQPGDYPFTKEEMADIKIFEGSALYPEFQRLRAAINDVGRHRSMKEPLLKVQATCSSSR